METSHIKNVPLDDSQLPPTLVMISISNFITRTVPEFETIQNTVYIIKQDPYIKGKWGDGN